MNRGLRGRAVPRTLLLVRVASSWCLVVACAGTATQNPSPAVEVPPPEVAEPTDEPVPEAPPEPPRIDEDAAARARAEQMFMEARRLMEAGLLKEACHLFEESMHADAAIGTLMNLGVCRERLGQKLEACHAFTDALEWATRENQGARKRFLELKVQRMGCAPNP